MGNVKMKLFVRCAEITKTAVGCDCRRIFVVAQGCSLEEKKSDARTVSRHIHHFAVNFNYFHFSLSSIATHAMHIYMHTYMYVPHLGSLKHKYTFFHFSTNETTVK